MDWHGESIVGAPLMYDSATLKRTVYQPLRPLETDTSIADHARFKLRT